VRPLLSDIKRDVLKTAHEIRSSTLSLEEQSDVLGELILDAKKDVDELRRQIKRKEDSASQELTEANQQCQEATEQYNDVELRVQRLQVECGQKRHELQQQESELERLRQIQLENRVKYGDEEQAFTDQVVPLLQAFTDHKEQSQEALQRVVEHCRTRLEELTPSDDNSDVRSTSSED